MKINGVELEDLDIYDLEVAERYEKALEDLTGIEEKVANKKNSESIRIMCNAVFNIFNTMFGEGTDKKVFGKKVNLLTCMSAIDELVEKTNEKKKEINKFTSKYSPNRAQKRVQKHTK
ncbi:MAG: DUF6673 family protein [Clostridium septicum]|uniref:DUF6673 family protein n=1 Tax=Clostridium septicum TaxID=1504 RepID=UPI0025908F65|nr:DUF6673 family protein [Clostridium septicum]MDU1313939.1 DUF6673 family protein [Clostridium septicum]